MSAKLKRLLADPNRIKPMQVLERRPAREIVAEVMAGRKAYRLTAGGAKGRFATQADLTAFLAIEISKDRRKHGEIARDAWISDLDLRRLIDAGKVQLPEDDEDD